MMPQPVAAQQGATVIRWLGRSAQAHASVVTQLTVRDVPPWVVGQMGRVLTGEMMR
jgi:hypothetical protein